MQEKIKVQVKNKDKETVGKSIWCVKDWIPPWQTEVSGPQKANICKAAACPHFLNGVSNTLNRDSINTCCHSSPRKMTRQTPIVTP